MGESELGELTIEQPTACAGTAQLYYSLEASVKQALPIYTLQQEARLLRIAPQGLTESSLLNELLLP